MTLFEAVVIGVVQGLTEFLPISSTAHVRIVPALVGWNDPGPAFSAVIQCGTLAAVLAYFRGDVLRIAQAMVQDAGRGQMARSSEGRLGWYIIVGTIPIVLCGVAFQNVIEKELRSLYFISAALIALALLLAIAEAYLAYRQRHGFGLKTLDDLTWLDAIILGLVQTLSLIPGSSRSGVTITGGIFRGMTREAAARFSFLLSLPAVLAAGLYELFKHSHTLLGSGAQITNLVVSTAMSALVGYGTIAFLLYYLKTRTTTVFIVYRIGLGLLLLWLLNSGHLKPEPPPDKVTRSVVNANSTLICSAAQPARETKPAKLDASFDSLPVPL